MKDIVEAFAVYHQTLDEGMMDWEYDIEQAAELFKLIRAESGKEIQKFLKGMKKGETVTLKQIRQLLIKDDFGRSELTDLLVKATAPRKFGKGLKEMKTFKEYLNEFFDKEFKHRAFIGLNKGREGMPIINPVTGQQMKDTKYLGKNLWLRWDDPYLNICSIDKNNKIKCREQTEEERRNISVQDMIRLVKQGKMTESLSELEQYIIGEIDE